MAAINLASRGTTQYNVQVSDPTGQVSAANIDLVGRLTAFAGQQLSKWVPGTGVIDVRVIFDTNVETAVGGSPYGTPTSVGFSNGIAVYETVFARELRTGVDANDSAVDVTIRVNPSLMSYYLDQSPETADVPAGATDFLSVMQHELIHALGMTGNRNADGQLRSANGTIFDSHVLVVDGKPYFNGPSSVGLFGGLVPLTPGNLYHYGTTAGTPDQLLGGQMNGVARHFGLRYDLNDLDLAILRDMGVTVSTASDVYAHVWGTVGADTLSATARTIFHPLGGNDTIVGSAGVDMVVYSGTRASYTITRTSSGMVAQSASDGVDQLAGVERVKFSDAYVAMDVDGAAGRAYRLYQAAFDRSPDPQGLGFQMSVLDDGWRLDQVAKNFIDSPEFQSRYGALSDSEFVEQLYLNVLHRSGETAGVNFHVQNLAAGFARENTLAGFSESPENKLALSATINGGMVYQVSDSQAARDGLDRLSGVEKLAFSDMTVDLGMRAQSAKIAAPQLKSLLELYVTFFNRVPDAEGLSFWIDRVHAGQPLAEIAEAFYGAALQYPELTGYSSAMSSGDFVRLVYRNVLGRTDGGDAEGVAFWSQALDSGAQSRGALVSTILATAHTFKGSPTFGYVADLLDNKAFVAEYVAVDQGITYNTPQDSIRNGMAIAAAVTPQSTDAAIALVGAQPAVFAVSSLAAGGTAYLANVERIHFSDVGVALDLDANAGKTAKIIGAVFGREALANKTYVGIGLQLLDAGMSYTDLSQLALNARFGPVFTNEAQVAALYKNVTGVDAPAAELAYYAGLVSSGQFSQAQLGVLAADSPANQVSIDLVGLAATGIEFLPQG